MAFVHCENCGWQQDDFWSAEGWNPFYESQIENFRDILRKGLKGEKIELDAHFVENAGIEHEIVDGTARIDFKEMLIWELDMMKKEILNMTWFTEDDFRNDPNPVCPQCGSSKDWDID